MKSSCSPGIRDSSYENQRYRASGLNLVVAAITLWNTVYLERAAAALRRQRDIDDGLLSHTPAGMEPGVWGATEQEVQLSL
jgi:hypothetical protein